MKIVIEKVSSLKTLFEYFYDGNKYFSHSLESPSSPPMLDDALFRMALLSRPKNSDTYLVEGVKIHAEVKNHFQEQLDATLDVLTFSDPPLSQQKIVSLPNNTILCFSGGFDSLATKALLDDNVKLLSIDFGGGLKREASFFKSFETTVVKWQLRGPQPNQKIRFKESTDWRFLLSPALLFKDKEEPLAIITGTIMEAAPCWFSAKERPIFEEYDKDYGPSVALVNPISCLTEYSTTLIVNQHFSSDKVRLSLDSLAAPASIKAFRKRVLLSLVEGNSLPKPHKKMSKHRFGSSFADDFLVIYFCWKCGKDWVLKNYTDQVPEGIESIDMSFVEKANQHNLEVLDPVFRQHMVKMLDEYKIEMYTPKDMQELEKVKTIILSKSGVRKGINLIAYRLLTGFKSSLRSLNEA